jgi:hypothetical protein
MKLGSGHWEHFEDVARVACCELHFGFFRVRLIVRTGVEMSHHYRFARLSHYHGMLGEWSRRKRHVSNDCAKRERDGQRQQSTNHPGVPPDDQV